MVHCHCFEAVDRTFRDILSVNDPTKTALPFCGKVVLGGDFRQILPVVEGGTKNNIIGASFIMSPLWRHVQFLKLTVNMRLSQPNLPLNYGQSYVNLLIGFKILKMDVLPQCQISLLFSILISDINLDSEVYCSPWENTEVKITGYSLESLYCCWTNLSFTKLLNCDHERNTPERCISTVLLMEYSCFICKNMGVLSREIEVLCELNYVVLDRQVVQGRTNYNHVCSHIG